MFQVPAEQSSALEETGELHSLEISQGPWQEISINIIEPLSRLNGINAIVVIID